MYMCVANCRHYKVCVRVGVCFVCLCLSVCTCVIFVLFVVMCCVVLCCIVLCCVVLCCVCTCVSNCRHNKGLRGTNNNKHKPIAVTRTAPAKLSRRERALRFARGVFVVVLCVCTCLVMSSEAPSEVCFLLCCVCVVLSLCVCACLVMSSEARSEVCSLLCSVCVCVSCYEQ